MKVIDLTALPPIIAAIEAELAQLPPYNWRSTAQEQMARKQAEAEALQRLRDKVGGTIDERPGWETSRVRIAGIQSTCTSGVEGALHNWCVAARRRLAP